MVALCNSRSHTPIQGLSLQPRCWLRVIKHRKGQWVRLISLHVDANTRSWVIGAYDFQAFSEDHMVVIPNELVNAKTMRSEVFLDEISRLSHGGSEVDPLVADTKAREMASQIFSESAASPINGRNLPSRFALAEQFVKFA